MSQAGREIELKFLCPAGEMDRLLAAAPPGEDEVRQLTSIYFDTPDGALAAAGVSLRIRDDGRERVQTLKRGQGVSREEHELAVAGAGLDLTLPVLRQLMGEAQLAALSPVSEIRVTRRQRLVRFEGAEIEIAVDLGEARAAGRASPISEVELELKAGPETALYALAEVLGRAASLTPSTVSKAARGRSLRGT